MFKEMTNPTALDFQAQWLAAEPAACAAPEPGQAEDAERSEPRGRARCFRVLLAVHRLLASSGDMPGLDEAEREESVRYQPGVSIYAGKMNRVKCQTVGPRGLQQESVYLVPSQFILLLTRPDEEKAFWAEPVIAEPLRLVRLSGDDTVSSDGEHVLRLQVASPRSPLLKPPGDAKRGYDSRAQSLSRNLSGQEDFVATPMPENAACRRQEPVQLVLVFSDELRRRVAWKSISQAHRQVCERLFNGVLKFLTCVKNGT
ncbi:unnamed protein product [Effrenium voratum]|uniref:Uncharacterized protein n=1 Tax=Effrenium voratum TaxID=2562239 RepID=A0AA36J2E2_9DINO|nr:unnamed protein product [Effrenium voratum]